MLDASPMEIQARQLIRSAVDSSPGDSWTAARRAGHLGLPVTAVTLILTELETSGHVVRVDGEWVSVFFADDLESS